jgi:acetyl esterase/lipase
MDNRSGVSSTTGVTPEEVAVAFRTFTARCGLIALIALPVVISGCGRPPSGLVGVRRSYTYCHNGGIPETLDVYEPTSPVRSAPTLVDIHGGGWVSGDADIQPGTVDWDVEQNLVARGWVFVSVDYRLAPSQPWPAQIQDVTCAVRYLRGNSRSLHIDPSQFAAIGASAGGHLASLLGLAGNRRLFSEGGSPGRSSAVQAVVDEYGPTDLTSPDWSNSKVMQVLSKETFGVSVGHDSPTLVAASPVTYVHAGAPPFLIIQGADDDIVPPGQSQELLDRLRRAGDPATLTMVHNAGHGLIQSGVGPVTPGLAALAGEVESFLTRQFPSKQ